MIEKVKAQKGLVLVGFTACALGAQGEEVSAQAGEKVEQLAPSTVLASRFEEPVDGTVSSVSVLRGGELGRMQDYRITESLKIFPGIQGLSTSGQRGNFESVLVRGLPTRYSQVVVDGVRVTDSSNGLNNFLSNTQLGLVDRLEFLRGPQSVLYGGEAVGGVLGYETKVGDGEPEGFLLGEAGSFDSYRAALNSTGAVGDVQYGVELGREFTGNDTYSAFPIQDYTLNTAMLGLKWNVNDDLSVKFSYRGADGNLITRTEDQWGYYTSDVDTDYHLFALNTALRVNESWNSLLTLGYYEEAYDADFDGSYGGSVFGSDTDRFSVIWSNKVKLSEKLDVVAGAEYASTGFSNSNGRDFGFATYAAFANSYFRPVENLLFEAGARYDEHEEYGGEVAWNLGVSYDFVQTGTRLRARAAESYRTPVLADSEAFQDIFVNQLANPDLETEEVLGFELGVDQEIGQDHLLQVTYFYQQLDNAIYTETIAPGMWPNPSTTQRQNSEGDSLVSGVETALQGSFADGSTSYRIAWTAQIKEEVVDVPDHMLSADLYYDGGAWLVGCGATYLTGASYGNPDDVNFVETDERCVARLYGHYQVSENVKLHGRIENVFDEEYVLSDIYGSRIQGQGFGAFAGVTLSW
ncbi:Outer membrane cobalamin receptor protein [Rubritalea squalenifaciens DSM 18772]|uniref:Outer membrane cobalamin receptor protein n=1 Tax=Rubritalea squalenifaciens DSM 18772 TaxID=1123071 RepID=A0A1M6H805_9BACT|nr:TonB-dependent receptor [Rubritalea squalenifaciens]SHJ18361.1 Outer membrane cobalamin receptor protein [Rubritalea squalenifaciens DSM 18772]